jgi:multicomponent Na+:H+ antiporter subunit C
MEAALALAVGLVLAFAVQALLRRSYLRMVIGFMLLSNAVNLIIFCAGRLTRGEAPIVPHHQDVLASAANPLPQALILTAIVISFGITAFAFTLTFRVYRSLGTLNTDHLVRADGHAEPPPEADETHLPA